MAYRDLTQTVFGDMKVAPVRIYRVQTEQSVYVVSFHEERGKKYVLVRGQSGTDREHVVVRDSEPRVGELSMFDVPPAQWVGQVIEVATMRTSPVASVTEVGPGAPPVDAANPKVPPPDGMSENPRIVPVPARGTGIADAQQARQLVMGQPRENRSALPYPARHVRYADDVVAMLRSIDRRERIFDDADAEQRARLSRALDDARRLIDQIRKRRK